MYILLTKIKLMLVFNSLINKLSEKNEELRRNFDNATLEIEKALEISNGRKYEIESIEKIKDNLDDIYCILKRLEYNVNIKHELSKIDFELSAEYQTVYKNVQTYGVEEMEAIKKRERGELENEKSLKILSDKKDNKGKIPVFLKLIKELRNEFYRYYDYFYGLHSGKLKNDKTSKYSIMDMKTREASVVEKYMNKLTESLDLYVNIAKENWKYKLDECIPFIKIIADRMLKKCFG